MMHPSTIIIPSRTRSKLFSLLAPLVLALTAGAQTPIGHTWPMSTPPAYITAESSSGNSRPFITLVDANGDSLFRAQPLITNFPLGFTLDASGTYAESIESASSLNYYSANSTLAPNTVYINSLPAPSCTANILAPANQLFALDYKNGTVDIGYPTSGPAGSFNIAQGPAVGTTPVAMTGSAGSGRYFVINQNVPYGVACNNIPHQVTQAGSATGFDAIHGSTTGTVLTLGKCPVYGTTSDDGGRSFIVNRGDDSVSVIDVPRAALDSTILLSSGPSHAGPVYAEYVPRLGKLLVANYENDTVSIINVQVQSNGTDGPNFGNVVATVDLWNHVQHTGNKYPAAISALPDGSRAYIANQGDGTISVLDLRLNEVVSTLTLTNGSHPRSIAVMSNAATNSLFAKIYVATPDSPVIPYLDAVDNFLYAPNSCGLCSYNMTNITDLRASTQNASVGGNNSTSSRTPGAGAPCELPNPSPKNLADCQAH